MLKIIKYSLILYFKQKRKSLGYRGRKLGGPLNQTEFSIVNIEFLWRALKFRGPWPPLLPNENIFISIFSILSMALIIFVGININQRTLKDQELK